MKRIIAYVMVLGTFGLLFVGQAADEDLKDQKVKVYVFVVANNDEVTNRHIIESHLKRELRMLGNVEIVDFEDDWTFRILIQAIFLKNKTGVKTGWVSLALSTHMRVPKRFFKHYDFPPSYEPVYVTSCPSASYWNTNGLPDWCVGAANSFEEQSLKPYLKMLND